MSTFGNGFLAFHVEVQVTPGHTETVRDQVKQWKGDYRKQSQWPGFPDTLIARLEKLHEVQKVCLEGPQSAVLIPLRMIQSLSGSRCRMSTSIGTGLISQRIEKDLESWQLQLEPVKRLEDVDSPLEFSFRDANGDSASLILYPCSRNRYQATLDEVEDTPKSLILNRHNQGLARLANEVSSAGGLVSFRPRELGRHGRIEDWVTLLPYTRHLNISSRHGTMKAFARHEGIDTPRGWPETSSNLNDKSFSALAEALEARMPDGAIVVLHRLAAGDTLFYTKDQKAIFIPAPTGYGNESRMARLQGALMALTSQRSLEMNEGMEADSWQSLCTDAVRLSFLGTASRPWSYPCRQDAENTAP